MDKGKAKPAKKYDVAHSEKLGRYMVASKDLSAGEVILREQASAVGLSSVFEPTSVFCFGCMRPLQLKPRSAAGTCSRCGVALVCNRGCERSGQHSEAECELFRANPTLFLDRIPDLVRTLLHLRLWLLRTDPASEAWTKIWSLEAHLERRRNTPVWRDRQDGVVQVFRKFGLLQAEDEGHQGDEAVQRLCGIVDVNSFELRPPNGGALTASWETSAPLLRGLYPEAALMAHTCRPSAHVTVDDDFSMAVHAAVPLKAGEAVTFNYTSSLLGTIERQEHLQEGKYFTCECEVCRDPLEAGSYLSCIVCPRCHRDYVALQKPRTANGDPYGPRTKWQCQKCKRLFRGCLVKSAIDIAKDLIQQVDQEDLRALEALLDKLSRSFHRNHFVVLCLKHKMLAVYRREVAKVNPQRKVLHGMIDVCGEMLELLEVVEPGISRLKGIMLYELQLPVSLLASREYAAREIDEDELASRLSQSQAYLRRALSMLLLEPAGTPEGLLAKRGLAQMKLLTQNIEDVRALPPRQSQQPAPLSHRHRHRATRKPMLR